MDFYLYPEWYSDAEEKTDFQWEFLKKPHFSFRILSRAREAGSPVKPAATAPTRHWP